MTFEEFIIKKKIDLAAFKTAEPVLFLEFQSHYSQMGEKSFDHSKKFLFNKLRRAYHLKEEPKPAAREPEMINQIASQAEPLLSPTVEATVYTPRFRAGGTTKTIQDTDTSDIAKNEKPAYTPRFKAPAKSPEDTSGTDTKSPQTSDPVDPASPPTEKPKPAYVPRFKAAPKTKEDSEQVTPATTASDILPQTPDPAKEDKPKPAYVPRFKPAITKPAEGPQDEDKTDKP